MSLADTIGFFVVLIVAGLLIIWLLIEAFWRLRQRNDTLRAETMKKRPAAAAPFAQAEHLVLALPHTGFNHDVEYPRDRKTQETFKDFLDAQFNNHQWDFVGFVADEAIVFRREKKQ